ncbi:MAG: RDD family protein [Dehalococcoidia bacterium]|nr:RDD family protein [Dehalococcoidia bacterium]
MTAPPPPESLPGAPRPAPARPPAGAAGPSWGGDGALRREAEADAAAERAARAAEAAPPPTEAAPVPSIATPFASAPALPPGVELATFWRRSIAWSIDFVLKSIVFQVVMLAAGVTEVAYPLPVAILIAGQLLSRGYDCIFFMRGRSPGGWLMGIRIVRIEDGGEPGAWRALLRTFGSLLSEVALGLGFAWALRNPRRQTWHDSIARTIVVVAAPRERRD